RDEAVLILVPLRAIAPTHLARGMVGRHYGCGGDGPLPPPPARGGGRGAGPPHPPRERKDHPPFRAPKPAPPPPPSAPPPPSGAPARPWAALGASRRAVPHQEARADHGAAWRSARNRAREDRDLPRVRQPRHPEPMHGVHRSAARAVDHRGGG